jgi:hypothetical protein
MARRAFSGWERFRLVTEKAVGKKGPESLPGLAGGSRDDNGAGFGPKGYSI